VTEEADSFHLNGPANPNAIPRLRFSLQEYNVITRYESNGRLNKVVIANGFAFLSGITAKDTSGDIGAQTADVLKQIDAYLVQAGTSKDKLVSANIWLSTMSDAAGMNAVWQSWIDPETAPARATVESKLASPDILVEIMVQAVL
jgi:enamine deaminase RidA (YjgF/YER057c/UK114 family)